MTALRWQTPYHKHPPKVNGKGPARSAVRAATQHERMISPPRKMLRQIGNLLKIFLAIF
jgi:hypothetical protein